MSKTKEELAREYTKNKKDYTPVIPTRQTVMDEQHEAFLAGYEYREQRASEGFDEWCNNEGIRISSDFDERKYTFSEEESRQVWIASRLSAQKEVNESKGACFACEEVGELNVKLQKEIDALKIECQASYDQVLTDSESSTYSDHLMIEELKHHFDLLKDSYDEQADYIKQLRIDLDFCIGGLVLHLKFSGALPNDNRMEKINGIRIKHNLDKVEGVV